MRSRFTAYALAEVDYLLQTHDPDQAPARAEILDWARRAKFTALEIKDVRKGGPNDSTGVVEFVAHFEEGGVKRQHRERSRFRKLDGAWVYVDGSS